MSGEGSTQRTLSSPVSSVALDSWVAVTTPKEAWSRWHTAATMLMQMPTSSASLVFTWHTQQQKNMHNNMHHNMHGAA
jgi:hypothetical protein